MSTLRGKPVDGRHLGCGGSCSFSRGDARGGPTRQWLCESGALPGELVEALFGGSPRRRYLHACAGASSRQRGARADQVGDKLPSTSNRGGRSSDGIDLPRLPLTCDLSAGCASKGARPPGSAGRREAAKAVARWPCWSCARGRPRARCAGFGRSGGCARRSLSIAEVDKRRMVLATPGE